MHRVSFLQPVPQAMQQMPVFIGHGEQDPLVPVTLARQTAEGLKKAGESSLLHTRRDIYRPCRVEL